jgi:hypothetical protein
LLMFCTDIVCYYNLKDKKMPKVALKQGKWTSSGKKNVIYGVRDESTACVYLYQLHCRCSICSNIININIWSWGDFIFVYQSRGPARNRVGFRDWINKKLVFGFT